MHINNKNIALKNRFFLLFSILYITVSGNIIFAQDIVVGITPTYPLRYYDKNNKPKGFFIDLLQEIANKENWHLTYINLNFKDAVEALKDNKIDVFPDMGMPMIEKNGFQYNKENVLSTWGQIFSRKGLNINSIDDFKGKRIATIVYNSFTIDSLSGLLAVIKNLNIKCKIIPATNYDTIFSMLRDNRADLGLVNRIYGKFFARQYGVEKTPIILAPISLRYAFSRNFKDTVIINTIDSYLVDFKKDNNSVYYKLLDKYFQIKPEPILPYWIHIILTVLLAVAAISLIFIFILRSLVKKRTVALRHALEEVKESDALKTAFLENISHEIRTPLNQISGFSQLIEASSYDKSLIEKYSKIIIESTDRFLSTINNIIDLARLQTNQLEIHTDKLYINDFLKNIFNEFQNSLTRTLKPDFKLNISAEDVVIKADISLLKQALLSLLDNAVKYTKDGFVELGLYLRNENKVVYVKDTGIGIPEEKHRRIFESFQKHYYKKGEFSNGMGISLALVKGIVSVHGWKITVDSELGKGTKFSIII